MIGGVANVMVLKNEYVRPNFGEPGDAIILTKPLGTQPAVNLKQKLSESKDFNPPEISAQEITHAYHLAMESMATLNKSSSLLLKKYDSHGATDVTGFGILGHA
jgi:selenide,water dikinase